VCSCYRLQHTLCCDACSLAGQLRGWMLKPRGWMLGLRLSMCTQGDKDLVKPMLEKRGSIHFGRVLMKPGKPLTFATISLAGSGGDTKATPARNLLVFGLPGAAPV